MKIRNLSVHTYANGMTVWGYTGEADDQFLSPDFWSDAKDMLADGDWMWYSSPAGGAILFFHSGQPHAAQKVILS